MGLRSLTGRGGGGRWKGRRGKKRFTFLFPCSYTTKLFRSHFTKKARLKVLIRFTLKTLADVITTNCSIFLNVSSEALLRRTQRNWPVLPRLAQFKKVPFNVKVVLGNCTRPNSQTKIHTAARERLPLPTQTKTEHSLHQEPRLIGIRTLSLIVTTSILIISFHSFIYIL